MEAAAPSAKRRAEAPEIGTSSTPATAAMETSRPQATTTQKTGDHCSQEPPPPGAGGEDGDGNGVGADRISGLPDAILGDIISLLPTKDGARTQVLASRWAHLWRAAPLNLDCRDLPDADDEEVLAGVVSGIISAHHGPGHLFRVPAHLLHDRAATVDAWLRSPALDNLQEIEFSYSRRRTLQRPPASALRFSATLRAATIGECYIPDDSPWLGIRFPQLQQLALVGVRISEGSLHRMISSSSCPALEYFFFTPAMASAASGSTRAGFEASACELDTMEYGPDLQFSKLVIEDAPCLEKLLCAERAEFHVSVMAAAAPKLETLGSLSNWVLDLSIHMVSFTSAARSVKVLSVDLLFGDLDMVIDLMKCFPCLAKLYIKGSISRKRGKESVAP